MAEKNIDMTQGRPISLLLRFALPLMAGNVFQQMYAMIDTAIVGNGVGVNALAAIGATDWLNWLVLGLTVGFPQGFSILISQYYGAKDQKRLHRAINASLTISIGLAILISLISLLGMKVMLQLMGTPTEILFGSMTYLGIIFAGTLIIMLYNLFAGYLRSLGNSKTPLYAMIIASIINIVLDCLFVFGWHWGIAGAAIATLIAQLCSALICLKEVLKIDGLHMHLELDISMMKRLWKLAFPVAFQNTIIAIGGLVVQGVVNGYGVIFIASYTATNKLYGLLEFAAISYGYAMSTYCGQNLGAAKIERISLGLKDGSILASLTSLVISFIMFVGGKQILSMFISRENTTIKQEVLRLAYEYLSLMGIFLIILFFLHLVRSALQGLGDTVVPMILGIGELVMRIGSCLLLPYFIDYKGIFAAEITAWTGALIILSLGYIRFIRKIQKKIVS